ncbi:MAG: ParB/RepB/Spo0J family partition protein [Gammaproteobacteria bacterium]|nr:ParB/RepB/Spo0J family partition protein [Gammaproteobacteria bacterium]
MEVKKRGLGRGLNDLGLNELLSSVNSTLSTTESKVNDQTLRRLPVEFLQTGKYQPRKDFDPEALAELADSIRAQGIIQPIVVRAIAHNRYEIIAGERRWRAAQLANLSEVPVIVREMSDESAIAMALIENIQREDLNSIEEAEAMQRLVDEFGLTHQQLSTAVGKSRAAVTNSLRLLQLSSDVKTMIERGDLDMGHGRALLALDREGQIKAAKIIVTKGFSVRETENFVRRMQQSDSPEIIKKLDPDTQRLQNTLSDKLSADVQIHHQASGKGKLVIKYNSLDELDGIVQRFTKDD